MKIKDRFLLGAISGFGGDIVKRLVMRIAREKKWAELDGPEKAAGMLLPAHKIATPRGKIIGNIADTVIASIFGVSIVYMLSLTGKDKAELKGVAFGGVAWTILYGTIGRMGMSTVTVVSPKTLISQVVAHATYGLATAAIVTRLGDPGLFTGEIPLSASAKENQNKEKGTFNSQDPME